MQGLTVIETVFVVDIPMFDMVYFVLPKSQLENIPSLGLFLRSPAGLQLQFIRAITLSLKIPSSELERVSNEPVYTLNYKLMYSSLDLDYS